jgi:hypothetical protein
MILADETKELLIKISATTELLRSQLGSAERSVAQFESRTTRDLKKIDTATARLNKGFGVAKAALAGFAGGFVGGLLSSLPGQFLNAANSALEYGSSLAEASQQLGVTVEDLQTYRYIAGQVGIEQESLDKGLARLTRTLGDVAAGASKPTKALKELGLSQNQIEELSRKSAGEALPLLADAFAKIESPAARARIEVALFGKSGQELDTLLASGGGAIRKFSDEFRKMGITITQAQAERLDTAADNVAKLRTQLAGKVTIALADHIEEIDSIANALGRAAEAGIKYADALIKISKGDFTIDWSKADNFVAGVLTVGTPFYSSGRDPFGNDAKPKLQPKISPGDPVIRSIQQQRAKDYLKPSGGPLKGGYTPFPGLLSLGGIDLLEAVGNSAADAQPEVHTLATYLQQVADLLDRIDVEPTGAAIQSRISQSFGAGDETQSIVEEITRVRNMRLEDEETIREKQEENLRSLAGLYSDLFSGHTGQIWRQFQQLGSQVIGQLLARFTLATISGKSTGGLGGLLSQSFSALGFGGFFAGGGNPPIGKASIVGERGPELFVPRIAGTVIPNNALGGTVIEQHFDLRGALVDRDVYSDMHQIAASYSQAAMIGGAGLARKQAGQAASRRLGR